MSSLCRSIPSSLALRRPAGGPTWGLREGLVGDSDEPSEVRRSPQACPLHLSPHATPARGPAPELGVTRRRRAAPATKGPVTASTHRTRLPAARGTAAPTAESSRGLGLPSPAAVETDTSGCWPRTPFPTVPGRGPRGLRRHQTLGATWCWEVEAVTLVLKPLCISLLRLVLGDLFLRAFVTYSLVGD